MQAITVLNTVEHSKTDVKKCIVSQQDPATYADFSPEDGGSMFLRTTGIYLHITTTVTAVEISNLTLPLSFKRRA
jgi:hypothetical protein